MVDDGLGDNILVLYDSVARRLGSPVVRKGPIPLTVVGGGPALVRECGGMFYPPFC